MKKRVVLNEQIFKKTLHILKTNALAGLKSAPAPHAYCSRQLRLTAAAMSR